MFRSGKHRHFQDRRNWPDEKLKELYKQSGTDTGMKIAITHELNARAGKTPLHSPQAKRQRALHWATLNANNTAGMLNRAVHELLLLARDLSDAEKVKITRICRSMRATVLNIEELMALSKELYPSKKSKKEKENA